MNQLLMYNIKQDAIGWITWRSSCDLGCVFCFGLLWLVGLGGRQIGAQIRNRRIVCTENREGKMEWVTFSKAKNHTYLLGRDVVWLLVSLECSLRSTVFGKINDTYQCFFTWRKSGNLPGIQLVIFISWVAVINRSGVFVRRWCSLLDKGELDRRVDFPTVSWLFWALPSSGWAHQSGKV